MIINRCDCILLLFYKVQDLRVQVSSKTDVDDQIMMAVNVKVEEWKV
jgi:hypothetical protein